MILPKNIFLCALLLFIFIDIHAKGIDVYFASAGKQGGIYHSKFNDENGKLTEPERLADDPIGFLAWHPTKDIIYAVGTEGKKGVVIGYEVDEAGKLKELNRVVNDEGGSAHLAVHPSGKFLITAQYRAGSVSVFPLNEIGDFYGDATHYRHENPSLIAPKRQEGNHPHWVGFSPDGNYAMVPDLGSDKIHIYHVDLESISLQPHSLAKSNPGAGPRHMRISADGEKIYLLNELSNTIAIFDYNAKDGSADLISIVSVLTDEIEKKEEPKSAAEILVHPSGQFVYTSNRGNDSVSCFRITEDKEGLELIGVEPARCAWPRNMNMDPSGNWILVAGEHSHNITVFKIKPDSGELVHQTKRSITIPQPMCILFR